MTKVFLSFILIQTHSGLFNGVMFEIFFMILLFDQVEFEIFRLFAFAEKSIVEDLPVLLSGAS